MSAPAQLLLSILFAALPLGYVRAADNAPAPEKPPTPLYETRQEHDPNGIGKFFMGREIAHVMGHQAAVWLERPERQEEERTDLLVEALQFKPGEIVADIGAGSGYFSWRIAQLIAPGGEVFAVDIQEEMLELLQKNMARRGVKNVRAHMGDIMDPKLPESSIDTMLMVDVYHEFDHPYEMAVNMVKALKPGGRLVFVEFRKEGPKVPIKEVHKMSEAQVKKEMALHALDHVETLGILPMQHIIIFKKRGTTPSTEKVPRKRS